MSPEEEREEPEPAKRLVCGACEQLLDGVYEDQAAAERAVEEHEEGEHPDREVVVVHVTTTLVETEGEEAVVEIASGAQERLDRGEVGEDGGILG